MQQEESWADTKEDFPSVLMWVEGLMGCSGGAGTAMLLRHLGTQMLSATMSPQPLLWAQVRIRESERRDGPPSACNLMFKLRVCTGLSSLVHGMYVSVRERERDLLYRKEITRQGCLPHKPGAP